MRARILAALCAGFLASSFAMCSFGAAAQAGGCFVGYGYGRSPCYPLPVAYGPPEWAQRPYDISAYAYAYAYSPLPVERRQLVRPKEFSHSGWDIYTTYGFDAYAAADVADDACALIRLPDWRGGWVWTRRAGCF
jgi:hypothetical protein